ncbi:hypothetical protein BC831DRAFT_434140 [Entophlyctis helioformis]|nr:hypothetical protein BC831DRAFT_434140 [Entophlyctis helioformis]
MQLLAIVSFLAASVASAAVTPHSIESQAFVDAVGLSPTAKLLDLVYAEGKQIYTCTSGAYVNTAEAKLYYNYRRAKKSLGTHYFVGGFPQWKFASDDDGDDEVLISGKRLNVNATVAGTGNIPWVLLQVTNLVNTDEASAATGSTHIVRAKTIKGVNPNAAVPCTEGAVQTSAYTAMYYFYKA